MYNVLVVDDDRITLETLGERLKSYGDFFTPIYACNGKEAVEFLQQQEISLLVTDLIMPGDIDGWALIEHIEENHPGMPAIVITSCEDEDKVNELQMRVRHLFKKPVKIAQLVQAVTDILNEELTSGNLNGVSIGSFLQLLEMEGKTCLLEVVVSPKDKGLLYIYKGKLYDALYGDYESQEAACQLIALDNAEFHIKTLPKRKIRQTIKSELMSVIMEAMLLKDNTSEQNEHENGLGNEDDMNHDMSAVFDMSGILSEQAVEGSNNNQTGESISPSKQKEKDDMALEIILEDLRGINGYKAAALMNFTGEILAADSVDAAIDLGNVGAVFNDIFRSSHEAAGKVGLQVCNELTMRTPNGLVIMACSGVDAPVHFHLIAVLSEDGNQALAKMQLDKMIPKIMDELS